jgi:uncharacterized protein
VYAFWGRLLSYCRRRWKRLLAVAILLVLAVMNLVAYLHARAFTHFAPPGTHVPNLGTITTAQKIGVLLTGASPPRPVNDISPATLGLAYTTLHIASDDVQLEAWHVPNASPKCMVVLFHGHGSCKCGLLREAQAFHELGCDCLLVDFRAAGGSTGEVCTFGVAEAHDVAAALVFGLELKPTLPVILFGQSMGSAAILRAVSTNQVQADRLILECPFDRLSSTVQHRFELMGLPVFPMARLLVFWGGAQHGFIAFDHNPVDYARNVSTPTLLMQGARDAMVHVSEAESIAAALAGPKSFYVFSDVGHESYLARRPEKWKELVDQFLRDKAK